MTQRLSRLAFLCVSLALGLSSAVWAQDNPHHLVAAAAATENARFLAANEIVSLRLEVFTLGGGRLYDSEFNAGNLLDWRWHDQQGQRLSDGTYRCLITVKDLAGRTTQQQGVVLVQNGEASWQAPEPAEAALRNTAAARAAEGIAYFATVTNPTELTTAVLAHDGKEARLMTGSGGLSVRTGNFLKGDEQEKLRLTAEGKLEVKGLISTGEGIVFSDGTVQKTAYVVSGQTLKQIAEDGKKLSPNAPAVGGSGTPNKLLKWAANGVDATDSTVTDLGPGGGISVNGSVQSTFYNVSASGTYMALWPAIAGSAMLLRSNSNSGNLWIGHLGNVGLGISDPGSRFATGGNATIGSSYYNTAAPTNGLLVEGNVGIGTTNPATRLHVVNSTAGTSAIYAESPSGPGVYGKSIGSRGVFGESNTLAGVWGTSGSGPGVIGVSTSGYGVHGTSAAAAGFAGYFTNTGGGSGVYSESPTGRALWGKSTGSRGVYGESANNVGVWGFSNNSTGVFGDSGGVNGVGGFFQNSAGGVALRVEGTGSMGVLQITGGLDLAEQFEVAEGAQPGLLVAIDPRLPGKLAIARGAYNRKVAGVISGANQLAAGMVLTNPAGTKDSLPIALSGRVWVHCDARRTAITPGDLLTTAHLPGHAMKALNHARAQGAIIGKAMTGLKTGRGLVLVLVTLQ